MRSVFFFDAMLTPKIITIVYWLLLIGAVVAGLGTMFTGMGGKFIGFLSGVGIIVGGALAARIWCELLMVLFKIEENTRKPANR